MKVLFTIDALINAGTEKSILSLCQHFSDDVQPSVAYFYNRHDLKNKFDNSKIPLFYAGLKGRYNFIMGIRWLIKLIQNEKPDLLVASLQRAGYMTRIAGKVTGVPVVGTFVNDTYNPYREEQKGWKPYLFYLLDKCTAPLCELWISNADSIGKSNGKKLGIPAHKIKTVYRGRDFSKFNAWNPPVPDEKFRFVALGRLLERKGYGDLIMAAYLLKQKNIPFIIDIYGAGSWEKELSHLIQMKNLRDSVILKGVVDDGFSVLYQYNAFLFPSWFEGFSGSLVEAMMTGIPIICSDIPMNLEAVTNGETAIVHKVRDAESLAGCMESAIHNYKKMIHIGMNARKVASASFDINVIARQYENVLRAASN